MKIQPGFLASRILFSGNNGFFLVARCFSIKTLNIRKVQDANVNILAAAAYQTAYSPDIYCYNNICNKKERTVGFFLSAFAEVFPEIRFG